MLICIAMGLVGWLGWAWHSRIANARSFEIQVAAPTASASSHKHNGGVCVRARSRSPRAAYVMSGASISKLLRFQIRLLSQAWWQDLHQASARSALYNRCLRVDLVGHGISEMIAREIAKVARRRKNSGLAARSTLAQPLCLLGWVNVAGTKWCFLSLPANL